MEKIFRALSEKNRLRIVLILELGPLNVSEIVMVLGLSQSNVSHHLKILSDVNVVKRKGRGNWAFYYSCKDNSFIESVVKFSFKYKESLLGFSDDLSRLANCYLSRRSASTSFFNSLKDSHWKDISNSLSSPSEYLSFILDKISIDSVALEVGAGDGSMIPILLQKAREVIAVDNSVEMLNRARKLAINYSEERIFLRLGDAEHLPLGDKTVNFVLMHMLLHHSGNPFMAIMEARRVLADNGVFVLIDLIEHTNAKFKETQGDLWSGFSVNQIKEYLEDANFIITQEKLFSNSKVLGFVAVKEKIDGL